MDWPFPYVQGCVLCGDIPVQAGIFLPNRNACEWYGVGYDVAIPYALCHGHRHREGKYHVEVAEAIFYELSGDLN